MLTKNRHTLTPQAHQAPLAPLAPLGLLHHPPTQPLLKRPTLPPMMAACLKLCPTTDSRKPKPFVYPRWPSTNLCLAHTTLKSLHLTPDLTLFPRKYQILRPLMHLSCT